MARSVPQSPSITTPDEKMELVGLIDGLRKSAKSWRELLLDLVRAGDGSDLAVADGALSFLLQQKKRCACGLRYLRRDRRHHDRPLECLVKCRNKDADHRILVRIRRRPPD